MKVYKDRNNNNDVRNKKKTTLHISNKADKIQIVINVLSSINPREPCVYNECVNKIIIQKYTVVVKNLARYTFSSTFNFEKETQNSTHWNLGQIKEISIAL